MDNPTKFTVTKSETTSSFDFVPGKDYFNLWILTSPLQFDETGLLLISLEIVDHGVPPTYTCYQNGTFDFCSQVWNKSVDVRAANPISLNCDAFKTSSLPAAGSTFVRRFTAPSIRLSPGFIAYAADPSGAIRTLRILPSTAPCTQAFRVASGVSNIQNEVALEQPKLENVKIYPSPSNGLVNIQFNRSELLNAEITVTDQSGRIVYKMSNKSESNQIQLNLQHLSNGLYFIKVNAQNKVAVKKVLISK
ncbi:T9SS type A sorting domain-containing protein [Niastella vici]|nr:T9SS type A sorting domain-containing protein [Niastella vici]